MKPLNLRNELIEEIGLIPDTQLEKIYNIIYDFRLSFEKRQNILENTLKFAGSWNDLTDEEFNDLFYEISLRRQQAFTQRRNNPSIPD
ncbi:hypothetical protein [Cyanothece sp. BG0011]|uniref:hypothetical protein n=1 Tax=Cyanothece sp. BG0011 TaxID=2082950 RepID=UPI000D1D61ED|nr:hypothetical protein [Cyanothece sp. BG0011]